MLKNIKIGQRLSLGFGVVLAMLVTVAAVGYSSMSSSASVSTRILDDDIPLVQAGHKIHATTLELRRFEKDMFLNLGNAEKEADYLARWTDQRTRLHEALTGAEGVPALAEIDREALRVMKREADGYEEALHKVLAQIRAGAITTPQDANVAMSAHKDTIRSLEERAAEFGTRHASVMEPLTKMVDEANAHIFWMLVTVLVAILTCIMIGFFITRSITGPLRQAVEAADRVAEGDITVSITADSHDEAGQLLSAMERMVRGLKEMANAASAIAGGDLKVKVAPQSERDKLGMALAGMVEKLTQVIGDVSAGATALSSASAQVSSTAQSLSQGTSEQAASVQETTSSLEQMSASVTQNAENSQQTERTAVKGATDATESARAVGETLSAMTSITEKISIIEEICVPDQPAGPERRHRGGPRRRPRQGVRGRRDGGPQAGRAEPDGRQGDRGPGRLQRQGRRALRASC